jgi:hypothetical protein
MNGDAHSAPGRSVRFWLGVALRLLAPGISGGFATVLLAAIASGGRPGVFGLAVIAVLGGLAWIFGWRAFRYFDQSRHLRVLQSGVTPLAVRRRPHVAAGLGVIAIAVAAVAAMITLHLGGPASEALDAVAAVLAWLLALGLGLAAVAFWKRSRAPMILAPQGLTDRTVGLNAVAWSRIRGARLWAPRGDAIGIAFDVAPEPGWDQQSKPVTIGCGDLAVRPVELLAMIAWMQAEHNPDGSTNRFADREGA